MNLQRWYSTLSKQEKGRVKEELAALTSSSIHTARSYLTGARPVPFGYALDICTLSKNKVLLSDLAIAEKSRRMAFGDKGVA
ncbi:hypothetical protein JJQ94_16760 [Pseudoalteromonas sp. GCY]|uniref:hypothetical protein n=1 Tax=Pseudoalteromonas sp. GCY TaxID=2003316 RepID=UPI00114552AA|nr:hypothetical protein [Pseudoalteromonas sp. GCY]QQQ65950.1 hypothetical protein JJQ94_16760 [Pseudoalteromonas sp. GCY]